MHYPENIIPKPSERHLSSPISVLCYNTVAFLYTNSAIPENSTLSFTFNEEIGDNNHMQSINAEWVEDTLINYHLIL